MNPTNRCCVASICWRPRALGCPARTRADTAGAKHPLRSTGTTSFPPRASKAAALDAHEREEGMPWAWTELRACAGLAAIAAREAATPIQLRQRLPRPVTKAVQPFVTNEGRAMHQRFGPASPRYPQSQQQGQAAGRIGWECLGGRCSLSPTWNAIGLGLPIVIETGKRSARATDTYTSCTLHLCAFSP
jgi:hypothetical protein